MPCRNSCLMACSFARMRSRRGFRVIRDLPRRDLPQMSRGRPRGRLTQHSLPATCCALPGPDFHRLDRASFLAHVRFVKPGKCADRDLRALRVFILIAAAIAVAFWIDRNGPTAGADYCKPILFSCEQRSRAFSRLAVKSVLIACGSPQVDDALRSGYVLSQTSLLNPIDEVHSVKSLAA